MYEKFDFRYSVLVSKYVQTVLTSEELVKHEDEFQIAKQQIQAGISLTYSIVAYFRI